MDSSNPRLKVLVVDDDEDLLEMIGLMLMSNGMKAECLADCRKLHDTLQKDRPHIILMDIFLKYDDGRDICRSLKTNGEYADIPVLLYSASNLNRNDILQCGANDFLHKPFEMETLLRLIRQLAVPNTATAEPEAM